jgi:hypothetical protein
MAAGLPLGAHVRGPSAWIVWQLLRAPLETRIAQLQRDPNVDPQVVRGLKQTASDLQSAAGQYREWAAARNAADSAEVPNASVDAGLKGPLGWGTASMVAASLGCSTRWITQLCRMGQLAAVKVGRSWSIDPDSVQDFKQRGANAA